MVNPRDIAGGTQKKKKKLALSTLSFSVVLRGSAYSKTALSAMPPGRIQGQRTPSLWTRYTATRRLCGGQQFFVLAIDVPIHLAFDNEETAAIDVAIHESV